SLVDTEPRLHRNLRPNYLGGLNVQPVTKVTKGYLRLGTTELRERDPNPFGGPPNPCYFSGDTRCFGPERVREESEPDRRQVRLFSESRSYQPLTPHVRGDRTSRARGHGRENSMNTSTLSGATPQRQYTGLADRIDRLRRRTLASAVLATPAVAAAAVLALGATTRTAPAASLY